MAICLFFLLGLTWIFGFLSISDARTVFAYLFCVFNSLHGFVIFVFFVLRKKNARRLWSEFVGSEDVMSSSRKSQNTSSQLPDNTPNEFRNSIKYDEAIDVIIFTSLKKQSS